MLLGPSKECEHKRGLDILKLLVPFKVWSQKTPQKILDKMILNGKQERNYTTTLYDCGFATVVSPPFLSVRYSCVFDLYDVLIRLKLTKSD